jgi:LPXTG-site transpeptidase (sortase) family protein
MFKRILAPGLILTGFVLIGASVAMIILSEPVKLKSPVINQVSSSISSDKPSQDVIDNYQVPAYSPKYIEIPSINVAKTRVIQLGTLKNNQIASPANIYEAGWYKNSSKPGQSGAMFIYGHVSSWTANGVFYNLKKLHSGDKITITRGDDTVYVYQVVSTEVYPFDKVPMNKVLSASKQNTAALNLMTCAGKIIKGTSEFSKRLVVYANLAKN